MKSISIFIITVMTSLLMSAQDISSFVSAHMEAYPKSRLLDLYKSCFQDYMGAEHLVSDRQRVQHYLDQELSTTSADDLMPWYYEPCGIDGRHVRVSLRTIFDGLITEQQLLDAFVRNAGSAQRPSVQTWQQRWQDILGTIDTMDLDLPHYRHDRALIDSVLSVGQYALSHSPEYRAAYHPHYRIVERKIFEHDILPLLERVSVGTMPARPQCCQD